MIKASRNTPWKTILFNVWYTNPKGCSMFINSFTYKTWGGEIMKLINYKKFKRPWGGSVRNQTINGWPILGIGEITTIY